MKNHRFEKYIYAAITAILVIAVSVLLVFLFLERHAVGALMKRITVILTPIIYGAVLAFLTAPVYNMTCSFVKNAVPQKAGYQKAAKWLGKTAGTLESVIFLSVIIVSLCYMIIPQLYSSIVGIINTMPVYIQNIYDWIQTVFENNPPLEQAVLAVYQQIVSYFQTWAGENLVQNLKTFESIPNLERILGGVSSGVMGIFNLTKNFLIGLIVMIYLLNIKDTLKAQCKKIVYAFLPMKVANATVEEFRYIHRVFSGFITGKLIDSLIIGVICFVLMKLFKLPFELLISVIVGVTNIIPFFGPFIGAIPSAVLVFLISPIQCLYFIGLILLLQQFDGNILGPRILGNSTGLSSFWVLFSILLFGGLFGFIGMIVAVPITAVVFDLFSKLQYYYLRKKGLSPVTEEYENLLEIDEESGKYIRRERE